MFDKDFDPLAIMEELQKNQSQLYANQQQLNQNIRLLVTRVNEQQLAIDNLIKGLEAANKANELVMNKILGQLQSNYNNFTSTGQH